jgi:hypothetical protein
LEKSLSQNRTLTAPVLCVCLVLAAATAAWSYIGGLPGVYMRSPAGAAQFAMGGAGIATADQLCAGTNPAMLARVKKTQLDLCGGLRSLGRTEGCVSLENKISPRVGMGLFGLYRGDPSLDNLYNENEDPIPSGSSTSLTCKVGLGYLFTRKLSAGLALGYYYQRLPTSYSDTALQYSTASAIGGFDFALRMQVTQQWVCAVIFQNIDILKVLSGKSASIELNWEVGGESFNYAITDKIPPVAIFASQLTGKLRDRPLLWACDLCAYAVDGDFTKLARMEVRLNSGLEWRRWDGFFLRAGIGDFLLNQDILSDSKDFWSSASPRISLGFGADLSKVRKGLWVNYGAATDRVWAGVDQRVDFSYSF